MKFLHLSDIHFLRSYPKAESGYNSIFNNITSPLIQLKRCLEKVDLEKIDFIIITGDLVESGTLEDYKVLRENLDEIFNGVPYSVTLGNHDNKKAFYEGWLNEEPKEEAYNIVSEIKDLKIISFDNSKYGTSDGFISEEQQKWLKDELKKEPKKDTVLMLHHHILEEQFVTPSVKINKDFEKMIEESSIIGIFSGHTHHFYEGEFAGKPYFTAKSICFVGINDKDKVVRFEESAGFNICNYENGQVSVEKVDVLENKNILGYVKF